LRDELAYTKSAVEADMKLRRKLETERTNVGDGLKKLTPLEGEFRSAGPLLATHSTTSNPPFHAHCAASTVR